MVLQHDLSGEQGYGRSLQERDRGEHGEKSYEREANKLNEKKEQSSLNYEMALNSLNENDEIGQEVVEVA